MDRVTLPISWSYVKLRDCCDIVSGATPRRDHPEYWGGDIPWVTPKDLSDLEVSVLKDAPEYITERGYKSCSTTLLPKGSILFSSRAPIGLMAIAGRSMCTNQGFKSLVPSRDVESVYLYHCLKRLTPRIQDMGRGATFAEIPKDLMGEIEIPLPKDIKEQKRIATILDKADAIRRKRQQAIQLATEFLRSVFLDMFGDPATNPKGWNRGDIRDLVSEVRYGSSGKAGEVGAYPMLRMNNVTYSGGWDFSALKYIDLTESEQDKYLVNSGDLLFNRTNSKELVGKAAVYRESKPMAFAGYLIRVRANGNADNEYIAGYLNSEHGKTTLRSICKSIIGMANINAQELQDIPILIPPLDLQRKYARIVQKVVSQSKVHQLARDESADLFQALSQRAFRGEL